LSQQCDFAFEILIHDDVSPDRTADIIREYEARYPGVVLPIYQTENQFSKGISIDGTFNFPRARGKYIALCEGDDFWCDPQKLQRQVDYMEAHPDCTFCFTNGTITDVSGNAADRPFVPYYEEERPWFSEEDRSYELGEMTRLSFVPTASFLFPRAVWEKLQEEYSRKMCEHGDLKMRLYFTSEGYGRYIHMNSCLYRQNVAGSAFQVWRKESAEKTARRAATVSEMIRDLDERTGGKYREEMQPLLDRYLFVELWNTTAKKPLQNPELRRVFQALPLKKRIVWRVKRTLPRPLIDGVKRILKKG
jgi:glycosyltransferase involved in cell wall biosynthesis